MHRTRPIFVAGAAILAIAAATGCGPAATESDPEGESAMSEEQPSSEADAAAAEADDWPWPDSLDAVAAAPDSHEVLLDNEQVRVLRVKVAAGEREPEHTHRWPSVMIVDRPARIRYFDADGELRFESPPDMDRTPRGAQWMGPEGLHSVENIDTEPFLAYRMELKGSG